MILAFIFSSTFIAYIARSTINIAIVSMVDPVHETQSNITHAICPDKRGSIPSNSNSSTTTPTTGKTYHWDQSIQGQILGSFYYGYIIFQLPAGIVAEKYGGKWVVFLCLFGSAFISFVTPFITDWHVAVFIFARFLMGGCQAGVFPASFGILCEWMPLKERSSGFGLLAVGSTIGSALPLFFSGMMIEAYGWPSLFYLPGILSVALIIPYTFLVKSYPEQHSLISKQELAFIRENSNEINPHHESNQEQEKEKSKVMPSIPWIKILLNIHVMTVGLFQFSCFFVLTVFFSFLPKYLNEVILIDIETNGRINGILNTIALVSLTTSGTASEVIIQKGWLSRTRTRKLFSLFTGGVTGICMCLIPSVGCDVTLIQVVVYTASIMTGFANGSDTPLASEMSNNFPAALFALLNLISTSSGFIAPAFAGGVLQGMEDDPLKAWSILFYTCGGISLLSTAIFLVFASAETQPFDFIEMEPPAQERHTDNRQHTGDAVLY